MKQLETKSFMTTPGPLAFPDALSILTWNINRGLQLDEVIEYLAGVSADLIMLQETDLNARRTRGRNIAQQIAQALEMNYTFGCEFEELTQQYNGMPAYHGQATLSRFPLLNPRIRRFHRQSGFWLPRWFIPRMRPFQRRLGGRIALINPVDFTEQKCIVYNVHLESRGNDELRCSQLWELLADVSQHATDIQIVIAGDFNADLRREPFFSAIAKAGLSNPFAHISIPHTNVPSRFNGPRAIDWIVTKGPLIASEPMLHDSIRASDHYPLSFILSDRSSDARSGKQQ